MLDPDLRAILNQADWESRMRFPTGISGRVPKNIRGRGLDFHDVRPYTYGDDVRTIDWNVTSRTGEVAVKEFASEETTPVLVFLDNSGSMEGSKERARLQLGLFFTLWHLQLGNQVQWFSFQDMVRTITKPFRREEEVFALARKLMEKEKPGGTTNFQELANTAKRLVPRYSLCYWISDFAGFGRAGLVRSSYSLWENTGIWCDYPIWEKPTPRYFHLFQKTSSEPGSSAWEPITTAPDGEAFDAFFRNQGLRIHPNLPLGKQLLPHLKLR